MKIEKKDNDLKKKKCVFLRHNYSLRKFMTSPDFLSESLGLALKASRTDAILSYSAASSFMPEQQNLSPQKCPVSGTNGACCPYGGFD